ncbi:HtaA domain-containing protein [Amycolatopsis sp. OK19-0408]|uniref:HtaA domain-containing protein n=1 Tax=Amycolatopsis iheyensis TaxID=2945988 RepID=A0A9X2NE13_9PSEU|nr:HtaA domain-containing protein [Amycolatopsis iheyensis]MCR6484984.1 HtaA domain-containing protein [Amycolatopsis iheyensis]
MRRLLVAAGAATLLGCLVVPPALAAGPAVTVTPATGLDPAGTSITVKGSGFDPAANDGKGFGVRVGPAKDDVRARTATGFQVSKLVKKDPVGTQIPLNADGSWELTVTVKAEYTSAGTTYNAKTQPFSVYVFGWDTPDLTWDSTTPLKFTGLGDPGPGTSGAGFAWGLKQSWRAYISRFGGTITPDRGATLDDAAPNTAPLPYRWPAGPATWDGTKGSASFGGRVVFTLEPHMIWQFSLANPKVTLAGDGTGKLSASIGYRFYGTKDAPQQVREPSEVDFADITVKPATKDGENVVVELASAKLTEAGAGAFAGFYPAGTDLDAGRLVFPGTPPTSTTPTTTPPTSTSTTTPPPTACTLSPGTIAQGNLLWGFKKSFRSYVGGGTGNAITADGGAEITNVDEVAGKAIPTGAYRFPLASGTLTSDSEFTTAFTGKITFSYPAHFFTLTLANPKITVAGGKGTLYADVDLRTTAGAPSPPVSKPGVALANLDLASAVKTPGAGTLTVSAIKATLTSADAFANFYQAGDVLDEPTVTLAAQCATLPPAGGPGAGAPAAGGGGDLVPDVAFRPAGLADTGVSLTGLYWGIALLAGGGGLVLLARRRVARGR